MKRIYMGIISFMVLCILSGCTRDSSYATLEKEFMVQSLQEDNGIYYAVTDYLTRISEEKYLKLYGDHYDPNRGYTNRLVKMQSGNTTRYQISEELYKQLSDDQAEPVHGIKQLYYIGKVTGKKLVAAEKRNGCIYSGKTVVWQYPYIQESYEYNFPVNFSTYVGGEPLNLEVTLDENTVPYNSYQLNIGGGAEETEILWSTDLGQNLIYMLRGDQSMLCYELYGDVSFFGKGNILVYRDPSYTDIRRYNLIAQKGYLVPGYTTPSQEEFTTNQWLEAYYPASSDCTYGDILSWIPYTTEYDWNGSYPVSDGVIHLEEGTSQLEKQGKELCLTKEITGTTPDGQKKALSAGTKVHPVQIDTNKLELIFTTKDQTSVTVKCEKGLIEEKESP